MIAYAEEKKWSQVMQKIDIQPSTDKSATEPALEVMAPGKMPFCLSGMKLWENLVEHVHTAQYSARKNDWEASIRVGRTLLFLHHYLMLSNDYQASIEQMLSSGSNDDYWSGNTLYEDDLGRLSLIRLYPGTPVPLHDHPGCEGAMMVISGSAEIQRYTLQSQTQEASWGEIVELDMNPDRFLEQYDTTLFGKLRSNIQGLNCRTPDTVILKVQSPSGFRNEQNWYYPLGDVSEDKTLSAKRVRARHAV